MKALLSFSVFGLAALLSVISGCAHAPVSEGESPEKLLGFACRPGRGVGEVRGALWMKAKSADASGQFPANAVAKIPDELKLEVTNLVGATQALITVSGGRYQIEVPGKPEENRQGADSWGGIPLRWAPELFLGRIPCPSDEALWQAVLHRDLPDRLGVEIPASGGRPAESFTYRFRRWDGHPWPEALTWEKAGSAPEKVEFSFDEPEPKSQSPLKWQARSSRGEVKVHWQSRKTSAI